MNDFEVTESQGSQETMKITIELNDYYSHHIGLEFRQPPELRGKPDFPEDQSPHKSYELREQIVSAAKEHSATVEHDIQRYKHEGVHHYDMGITWSVFDTLGIVFGGTGFAVAFLKYVSPLISEWLKNRGSRSIKVKIDGKEIEITGKNNPDSVITLLQKLEEQSQEKKHISGKKKSKRSLKRTKNKLED